MLRRIKAANGARGCLKLMLIYPFLDFYSFGTTLQFPHNP
jgi:hypothetical protein